MWKQHRLPLMRGVVVRTRPLHAPENHVWVVACQTKFISLKEMERMRRFLRRLVGKKGKVWARERTLVSLHKKSKGARMGKGIGSPAGRCVLIREGERLFEAQGLNVEMAQIRPAMVRCLQKFSFGCRLQTGTALSGDTRKGV